jgi:hypothetical protein
MKKKRIGIVILATNVYFILGLRFMRRFMHFYKGEAEIVFYFFSNEDPRPYIPEDFKVKYYKQNHSNWVDGTNSKFKNIVNIQYDLKEEVDYVYYFDADTNVDKDFTEEWFLEEYVAGEHYGNRDWLANGNGFQRQPYGFDYVDPNNPLPYTYRYGAFFGGSVRVMVAMCETLMKWQIIDTHKGYEPPNNDEGYLNAFFHNNPPSLTVPTEKFSFLISDKGGFEEVVRISESDVSPLKRELLENKEKLFDLKYKKIVYE